MRRGTTPTLKIKIDGVDLSEFSDIYITVRQGSTEVTKTAPDIIIDGNTVYVPLTQEDTLSFSRSYAYVQMRAITLSGLAVASDIEMVLMEEVLQDGVIL